MSRLHHRFPCHNTAATMFDRWSGLYLSLSILFSLIQVHVYFFGPIWSQNSADAFRGFLAKCNLSFSFLSSLPSARAFKVFDNHTPASLREYTLCVVRCCEVVFLNITVHFSCLLWSFRPFDVAEMASLLFSKSSLPHMHQYIFGPLFTITVRSCKILSQHTNWPSDVTFPSFIIKKGRVFIWPWNCLSVYCQTNFDNEKLGTSYKNCYNSETLHGFYYFSLLFSFI